MSLGVGREWVPPKVNGWQSPSREAVSCWNHCPGAVASSGRYLPGETRPLQAAVCRWDAADGDDGSRRAGPRAHRCRPGSLTGSGWAVGVCPACSGSPARSGSPGRSPSVRGRGRAGPRGGGAAAAAAAARSRERPRCSGGTWSAIPGTKASTTREGTGARGGSRRLERKGGGGAAGGRLWRSGRWRLARGPSPSTRPPGPRVSRPRSPRPPPIQRPASSRPGSPGNH